MIKEAEIMTSGYYWEHSASASRLVGFWPDSAHQILGYVPTEFKGRACWAGVHLLVTVIHMA